MLFLFFVALSSAILINDPKRINAINSNNLGWTAGANKKFSGVHTADAKNYLGLLDIKNGPTLPAKKFDHFTDLPENFDWRVKNPSAIRPIRDQARCGSCWAFGTSESFSDRWNIHYNSTVVLSPQTLVSCDKADQGCNGGWPINAWNFIKTTGLTTDSCYPYMSGDGHVPKCANMTEGSECPSGPTEFVHFYKVSSAYSITGGMQAMMQEIYDNGPIEVGFHVYADFFNYKRGVYKHTGFYPQGGHAVKIVGWGVDPDSTPTPNQKYWIVANSWGTDWGELGGFFWILRGTDECNIESWSVTAGTPVSA
jgi:cathepsin B